MTGFQRIVSIITAGCFVILGAWSGTAIGEQARSTFNLGIDAGIVAKGSDVVRDYLAKFGTKDNVLGASYLLIGVNADYRSQSNPAIESIWAVTFDPAYSMVELLGIVPTREISEAYHDDPDEFTALVSGQLTPQIRRQFVLDSAQFIWIIDTLGGLQLTGTVLDGVHTLNYVRSGRDIDEKLLRQASVVQALAVQVAVIGPRAEVTKVLAKVRAGTLSREEINMITGNFSPLRIENVRVGVVTIDTPIATRENPPA